VDVHAAVSCDQVKDVAAVSGSAIGPEARFLAFKNNLQAVTGTTEHIADKELAAPLLAGGEHRKQDRLQP
jgi:hypothetical protein